MTHVCRLLDAADGSRGQFSGWYVVDYDPSRMPAKEREVPPGGVSSTHCRLVLSPFVADAASMRPSEWLTATMVECRCGAVMPSGRPCRPITGYTLAIEPLDAASALDGGET